MPWPDSDRRGSPIKDTGQRRRARDFQHIEDELRDARERLWDAENELLALKDLPARMGELKGSLETLLSICQQHLPGIAKNSEKATSRAATFLSILQYFIAPIAVALIGAYVVLKTAVPREALP